MKSEIIEKYPLLLREWNFSKNGEIPENITINSKIRCYFNCERCDGKEYYISLKDWFRRKRDSKICRHYPANQIRQAKLRVSLAEHSPELILEWADSLDYNLINYGSEKIVNWKCSKCSSLFKQKICKRASEKVGCPYCAGKKINDVNSLGYKYPELSKQLIFPDAFAVSSLSSKIGKWRCVKCCEEFKSAIHSMVSSYNSKKLGCPYCSGKKINHNNNLLATNLLTTLLIMISVMVEAVQEVIKLETLLKAIMLENISTII